MKRLNAFADLQHLVVPTILGALALGCGAYCVAGDHGQVPHTVVKTADLDLSSPEGASRAYSRIRVAAYEVCKSFDIDSRDRLDLIGVTTCVDDAVRDAVVKFGHPALLAIYNAKNHDRLPIKVAAAQNR